MAKFFIDRPVFAIVISLFLILSGVISLLGLPIAQFPEIALPTVKVTGVYPGATAEVVEEAVSQPIDSQINGVTDMKYIKSVSSADGTSSIQVTFQLERDPDIAAVETQNRVSQVLPRLPQEVNDIGVSVTKSSPDTLMYVAFFSEGNRYNRDFINNYINNYVVDEVKRITGVGDVQVFGDPFAMRVWLNPVRLSSLGLTPADIVSAIQEQNLQAAPGTVGQLPTTTPSGFQYSLQLQGRLVAAEEFGNIVVRRSDNGSLTYLRDVARIELGAKSYQFVAKIDGKTAAAIGVSLSPGANAMQTSALIQKKLEELKAKYPPTFTHEIIYNTSEFVAESIAEVEHTLRDAFILVLIVVFVFLQNWRTTLVPMLAIPVSLIATMIAYQFLGFSINTLSLFGLVLAIGIVVDDAIVVVEAVEEKMATEGLSPRDATRAAMSEVSGPVVAIALVLSAVFIPMAFVPGVTGQLYKQFALTIAVSTMFSALVALTLTPALCTLILKPHKKHDPDAKRNFLTRFFDRFNVIFDAITAKYGNNVMKMSVSLKRVMIAFGIIVIGVIMLFRHTPAGFVPDEDVGAFFVQAVLPDASNPQRTQEVIDSLETKLAKLPGVESILSVNGFDVLSGTAASNGGLMIVRLKPWHERHGDTSAEALIMQANMLAMAEPRAIAFAFGPPALPGFGASSGFSLILQAKGGQSSEELAQMTQNFIAEARKEPAIGRVSTTFTASTPNYSLEVDRTKAKQMGISLAEIYRTLQINLGSLEVNDFTRDGRNYRVILQADAPYREDIEALQYLKVRNAAGEMVPLNALVKVAESTGPRFTTRFNLYKSAELTGSPAPGYSSGQAMAALEKTAANVLQGDYGYAWSGMSLEEKETGNSAAIVMLLSIVVVFLFLAALYESWSIPMAVLLCVPFGVLGALLFIMMRGLQFDVYGQIGVVTLVGLSAKNAILIVEFAKLYRERGWGIIEATVHAAQLRLRPILMTSFAFILGVVPLYIASGAGAASKHSVGTVVFGGMSIATAIGIFFIPAFYVLIQSTTERIFGTSEEIKTAVEKRKAELEHSGDNKAVQAGA